jgi:TDG/mug DNA glycosylase family protein
MGSLAVLATVYAPVAGTIALSMVRLVRPEVVAARGGSPPAIKRHKPPLALNRRWPSVASVGDNESPTDGHGGLTAPAGEDWHDAIARPTVELMKQRARSESFAASRPERGLQRRGPLPGDDPFLPPDLTLEDILEPGLDLVFVGINPSIYSALCGHYFARPSNRFWACLNQSGLVPERVGPEDDVRLPSFGIGLTDIVKRATHDAAELSAAEFADGREMLRGKLLHYAPRAVCFVGKLAYTHYRRRRSVPFGEQPDRIGDSVVFVMPSTSGLVNNLHAERLRCLEEVRLVLGR